MDKVANWVIVLLRKLKSRTFAAVLLTLSLALTVIQLTVLTRAVYIRDGEETILKFTIRQDADDILEENGIATMACDIVDFDGFHGRVGEISITRVFPVEITADGSTQTVMVTGGTVGDAMDQVGLSIDSDDLINYRPGKPVEEGDRIFIQRVEYTTVTEESDIPYETITKSTSLIPNGRTRVLTRGENGHKVTTYIDMSIDGVPQERELVGENITKRPVTEEILVGDNSPISPLQFGTVGANGAPTNYRTVLTGQRATGYSAKRGAWGASGMRLSPGYVATNPNEIPYGTKMYIASPDGSFVYGYAIAADTGTGLMQDVIDVDLFYDTYTESCLSSHRIVNIYILD